MPTNPFEPPQEVNKPGDGRTVISLGLILKETLSAFGCVGAAIAMVVVMMLVLTVITSIGFQMFGVERD